MSEALRASPSPFEDHTPFRSINNHLKIINISTSCSKLLWLSFHFARLIQFWHLRIQTYNDCSLHQGSQINLVPICREYTLKSTTPIKPSMSQIKQMSFHPN